MMQNVGWIFFGITGITLAVLISLRILCMMREYRNFQQGEWAITQTTGTKEIQADCAQVYKNQAGTIAVLSDGIGEQNTGKLAAQIVVDTMIDSFTPYHMLNNPAYLFKTAARNAHNRVQKTIGNRKGGANMGGVFISGKMMHYALVGNVSIALYRNQEIIRISEGQTMNVLAKQAYKKGLISKKEAIRSLKENRTLNYLGKDGFNEIEISKPPILLKPKDVIVIVSQGIFKEISWAEMEEILIRNMTLKEKADCIVMEIEKKGMQERENGSVLLLVY